MNKYTSVIITQNTLKKLHTAKHKMQLNSVEAVIINLLSSSQKD